MNGPALIANMGVEDEFGPEVPAERVLNAKSPLNFVLEEPTHLKYIDPTMALDNYGALEVLGGALLRGSTVLRRRWRRRYSTRCARPDRSLPNSNGWNGDDEFASDQKCAARRRRD